MEIETVVKEQIPFTFPIEVLKHSEVGGDFHVVGYAATTDFDLQGDVITEDALKASSLDLLKNSTVLLNHDLKQPIGKVTKVQFDRHGLLIDVLISQTEPDIIQKIKEGVLNKFSIRGQVLEREKKFIREYDRVVNVIKRMALVEVSLVSVPANPEARAVGWYVSKALEESDLKSQGGNPMSEEEVVIEKISPEGDPPKPQTPDPSKGQEDPKPGSGEPKPEPEKTNPKPAETPAKPDASNPAPAPQSPAEIQKNLLDVVRMQLEPVWALLDKLIAIGGDTGRTAQQIKATLKQMAGETSYPFPSQASKIISKEEIGQMISSEVSKQIETAVKSLPAMRKGLVQPETNVEDVKKQFESLSPEKKLRAALALQQG